MDSTKILRALESKLGQSSSSAEAFAMLGGLLISIVLNAILWLGLYLFLVFRTSNRYGYGGLPVSGPICVAVVLGGMAITAVAAKMHSGTSIGTEIGAVRDSYTWFSRGEGAMAGGCVGSLIDFLGGNILGALEYFFRPPALSRNQYVVATALISCCLQEPGVSVNVAHDSILGASQDLTEGDFEKAVSVLRDKGVLEGQSNLSLTSDFHQELTAL